jgi:transcriptional regulator with XRE-family HTH domain
MDEPTRRFVADPEAIERHRTLQGLSRAKLARAANISPSQLWKIEKREHVPGEATTKKIADALGVPVATILKQSTPPPSTTNGGTAA